MLIFFFIVSYDDDNSNNNDNKRPCQSWWTGFKYSYIVGDYLCIMYTINKKIIAFPQETYTLQHFYHYKV